MKKGHGELPPQNGEMSGQGSMLNRGTIHNRGDSRFSRFLRWLDGRWHILLIAGVVGAQALLFLLCGENSYLTVQDHLDLFVPHYRALTHYGLWFAQDATVPILGGISRDSLGSEFSLYNQLFMLFPAFYACLIGYFLKIFIGMGSFVLLARELCAPNWKNVRQLAWASGLCYGMLPLFPAYGIAFASLPLAAWLLIRVHRTKNPGYLAALFFYPYLSYFSYFGFFLLAYLAIAIPVVWIREKKPPRRLIAGLFLLAAGYVCFEYRLFRQILFSDVATIRETMTDADLPFGGVLGQIWGAFVSPVFHASSDHLPLVLPVCLLALSLLAMRSAAAGMKSFWKEKLPWALLFIVSNCGVYGLYFWGGFRRLFESVLPPLKGFQFNRTVFFNPFLWYLAFFLSLIVLAETGKTGGRPFRRRAANLLACAQAAVILLTPAVYNEFYWTLYHQAYRAVYHTEVNLLNFREYYSVDLMEKIKEDIDYDGSYAAGYGLNPAVLTYNGIAALDGYLGFYPQSYKEEFTRLIRPAYEKVEEWRTYYGEWGARAYLYPGSGESIYNPYRNETLSDRWLFLDGVLLRRMGGRYLFSRFELKDVEEQGFSLRDVYEGEGSPYTIWLYETHPAKN